MITDQLQDIEQEVMFRSNKRKADHRFWTFVSSWMIVSFCVALSVLWIGIPLVMLGQPAAILYGESLKKKYPFKPEHLKP